MAKSSLRGAHYPQLWAAMLRLQQFTTVELLTAAELPTKTTLRQRATDYLLSLVDDGALMLVGRAQQYRFALVSAEKLDADELTDIHRCWLWAWNRKTFSTEDLQVFAKASCKSAHHFCLALKKVGYLEISRKRVKRNDCILYRLVAQTGPLPIRIRANGDVYDPNIDQVLSPVVVRN